MRKRTVLKFEPCESPACPTMTENCGTYGTREVSTIAKAQILMISDGYQGDVLNVDLFHDGVLKVRYFADRNTKSHRCLVLDTGEWKQLCIQNAANVAAGIRPDYSESRYYCDMEKWAFETDEDEDTARGYFDRDIRYWESDIMREKRYRQLENKQARIDALMEDVVPDIPEDFYRWIHEDVFGQRHLFQQKLAKMTRITCTACGAVWRQKKAIGIGVKACPRCGKTVRGTYKKEEKSAEKTLYLFQPCRIWGRWIERCFKARCTWSAEHVSQVSIDEQIRIIVPNGKDWGNIYYEDFIHEDGTPSYWDTNHTGRKMSQGYLYPGNIREMGKYWPETLTHSGIGILAQKGIKFNVNQMIVRGHTNRVMEYLIKGGFYRLATDVLHGNCWSEINRVHEKGRTAKGVLRLTPDRINRLRQMDGGSRILGWLRYEQKMGRKISQSNLLELDRHGISCGDSNVWRILSFLKSADVFANYIRKQAALHKVSRRQVIDEYVDYLDMAKKQRLNLTHELFYKPRDLKAAHDECVRAAAHEELKHKAEAILERFPDVEKIMDSIREKYSYDGAEYSIVVPSDVIDIIHEGRALGHCIDTTDRYFDRIQNHITHLVFLRRASAKSTPYYTLEIEPGGTVRQQRTTGNNQNKEDVKEYTPFLQEWQQVVRKRISAEDRELAEISRRTRIREYQELRDKQEKVWRGALAGKLLDDVLESDLIETI